MSNSDLIFDTTDFTSQQKAACLSEEPCPLVSNPDEIYDLATDIGHDFEKLVQTYGYDAFATLLPKVVHALESLENAIKKSESTHAKLNELRQTVVALEKERVQRNNDRLKFENDVDEMETQWRVEKAELMTAVRRLTEENKSIQKTLETLGVSSATEVHSCQLEPVNSAPPPSPLETAAANTIISQLQQKVARLSEELNEKKFDCDALHSQLDRLARQNAALLEKHALSRQEIDQLVEEKADLEAQMAIGERKVQELLASLTVLRQKEKDELDMSQMSSSKSKVRQAVAEQNELRYRLVRVDEQLKRVTSQSENDGDDFEKTRPFERHYSLEDANAGTPLPDLNLPESEERVVYGPINREPEDKADPDAMSTSSRSIRDFFERMFLRWKFLDKKGIEAILPV